MRKTAWALTIAAVTLVTVLVFLIRPVCSDAVKTELASPDSKYVAAVFEENCHATTPVVTHINVRRQNEQFSRKFLSGTVDDGTVLALRGGGYDLKLLWNSGVLIIQCPACSDKFIMEKRPGAKGVNVQVQTKLEASRD